MYIVYVLKSKEYQKSYVGMTKDLGKRVKQHNDGQHAYTKKYMPWKVVYTEKAPDRDAAGDREKYLKSAAGRRFLKREVFNN